jgi:hypothetical protein
MHCRPFIVRHYVIRHFGIWQFNVGPVFLVGREDAGESLRRLGYNGGFFPKEKQNDLGEFHPLQVSFFRAILFLFGHAFIFRETSRHSKSFSDSFRSFVSFELLLK